MNWADYALDLEERLDAANRGRLALATELAALKARRCNGCRQGGEVNADEVLCRVFNTWMPFDHACNAHTPTTTTEPMT